METELNKSKRIGRKFQKKQNRGTAKRKNEMREKETGKTKVEGCCEHIHGRRNTNQTNTYCSQTEENRLSRKSPIRTFTEFKAVWRQATAADKFIESWASHPAFSSHILLPYFLFFHHWSSFSVLSFTFSRKNPISLTCYLLTVSQM